MATLRLLFPPPPTEPHVRKGLERLDVREVPGEERDRQAK